MRRHSLALPRQKKGGTEDAYSRLDLPLRLISSSLGVARTFSNKVEKDWENVQTLWWAELNRLHSMTRAHPPLH